MQRAAPLPHLLPIDAIRSRALPVTHGIWVVVVLAAGLILRGLLLGWPGLHPDEALYASWALRIADGSDPALLGVYVDKPPFLLYLLAGLFRLAGFDGANSPDVERLVMAGRLAALLASGASLILLWLIGRRVYGAAVAVIALALFAVSPLAVRLAPTLFTDPWLVLWVLLGLWAAVDRRAMLAGLACGLAYATKQQAVLLVPLLLAVFLVVTRGPAAQMAPQPPSAARLTWRWLNGFALVAVIVLWWDSLRWQWMPSYWERSAQVYGGVALAADGELPGRLAQWGELLGYAFGGPLWLALGLLLGWALMARLRRAAPGAMIAHWFDWLLLVFVFAYLLLHVATNLAPWDRYLLPLVPLLALLLARAAMWAWRVAFDQAPSSQTRWPKAIVIGALAVGLLNAGRAGGLASLPLSDGGVYDGVPQIAAHMRSAEPAGAVLYHHWLGWHFGFYLYDAPVDLRWWQDPADLARKATASAGKRQLVAFSSGREDEQGVRTALEGAGLTLRPVLVANGAAGAPSVTLYSIEPAMAGAFSHAR